MTLFQRDSVLSFAYEILRSVFWQKQIWIVICGRISRYSSTNYGDHNKAILKPPCHSGSNQRKSPVFEGNTRTFRTAKFFLLMFFLIQFHSSVFIRRDIEVVITRRSWKPFESNLTRVRIPFPPPSKNHNFDTSVSGYGSCFRFWLDTLFLQDLRKNIVEVWRYSREKNNGKNYNRQRLSAMARKKRIGIVS